MRRILFALSGAAVALAAVPADAKVKTYVCTKWKDGLCVSTHRVKGTPAAYKVGYVFGPNYSYTTYSTLPRRSPAITTSIRTAAMSTATATSTWSTRRLMR